MAHAYSQKPTDVGPEEVLAVFTKKVMPVFVMTIAVAAVACAVIWLHYQQMRLLLAALGAALLAVFPLMFEVRRKIVFTSRHLVFNPGSGDAGRIPLAQIANISETTAAHLIGFMPISVPAVRLTLTNGQFRTIPIDFPDRLQILARLREISADEDRQRAV